MPLNRPALSERLAMVARMLPSGDRLIDIGTDHAYLPITAVMDGQFRNAIAADVRPGPLLSADRNIRRFGCSSLVQTVLSDGLDQFSVQSGDVVVMAGLGGLEMADIIDQAPGTWPILVLQPQKSAPLLRRRLADKGYVIHRESICLENRRLYLAMMAFHAPDVVSLNLADQYIGPVLLRERPPLFRAWLEKQRIQVLHAVKRDEPLMPVLDLIEQMLKQTDDRQPGN